MSRKLTQLEAFTQYAFYVKAYVLPSKIEAKSETKLFTTLPGTPEKVERFKAATTNSSALVSFINSFFEKRSFDKFRYFAATHLETTKESQRRT